MKIATLLAGLALLSCTPPGPTTPDVGGTCEGAAHNFVSVLHCAGDDYSEEDFVRLCEGSEAGGGSSSINPGCVEHAETCVAADKCQLGQAR